MSRLRALAANMAAIVSGKAMGAVAGLLTIMVLTRHLGPQEFGYYRTVLTYTAFASVLADSGIYMVALREMSRPGADAARVFGNALPLRLISTASVLLAASAVAWTLPYDPIVKWGILVGAAIYTCLQASDFLIAVFQSVLKQGRNAIAEVTGAVVTLVAVWILAATHAGALAMLGATLLGSALAVAVSWRLAARLVPFHLSFDLRLWRHFLVIGLPMAGSQILGMAMLRGDSLLLSFFQPAADVGLYGVPTKLFELATSLPYLFAGLMMPALTASAGPRRADFPQVLGHTVDTAAVYGVGAILAMATFAPQLLTLVAGAQFAAGAPALVIIAFAAALAALNHVLRFALVACERPRFVLAADATACVFAFAAYFTLIPKLSLIGAAIGTLVAESCALACMLWGLKRAGSPLPSFANPVKAAIAGGVAAAAMWGLNYVELPWVLSLLLGGGLYLAGLAVTRAIPLELLVNVLRRRGSYQRTG
jgi:O-antigen/teichoic acid export membrane protein